jgi:hypothetical protein
MKKKIKRDDSIYFVHRSTVSLVFPFFAGNDDLSLTGEVSKEAIDFFTAKILAVENFVEDKLELKKSYQCL